MHKVRAGIQWSDDLAVRVGAVDEQHRELFRRLNLFLDACDAGKGTADLVKMLQFLDDYVSIHFRDEERLQEEFGFPFRHQHRSYHRSFEEQLGILKKRFIREGPTADLVATINRVVVGWLLDHISRKDREFGEWVRAER
jgi:hemerythrin